MDLACGEWLADVCSVIIIRTACDCTPEPLAGKGCTKQVSQSGTHKQNMCIIHIHNMMSKHNCYALQHTNPAYQHSSLIDCGDIVAATH